VEESGLSTGDAAGKTGREVLGVTGKARAL
jgi:hypothetical protein